MERFVEAAALQTGRVVLQVFSLPILKTVVQTWHRSDKLLALQGGVVLLQQPGGLLVYIASLPPRAHCLSTDPGQQKHPREPCWVIILRTGIYRRLAGWGDINGSFEAKAGEDILNVIYIGGHVGCSHFEYYDLTTPTLLFSLSKHLHHLWLLLLPRLPVIQLF